MAGGPAGNTSPSVVQQPVASRAQHLKETDALEITIYHNPNCGTSRNALFAIRAAGYEPRILPYMQTPLSREAIAALASQMKVPVRSIVRKKEPLFAELGLNGKDVSEEELLDILATHPILLNRPIVVVQNGEKTTARLCRPSETVKELIAAERARP
jgi:arsenate reductase